MIFRTNFAPFQSHLPATFRSVSPGALPARQRLVAGPQVHGGWSDDGYQLRVDLPGVPESAVHVSVAGRTLTLDVDHSDDRRQLRWSEQLRLPQTLDPEQVNARYVDGQLTVTIGRSAEPAARTIAIDTTPAVAESTASTQAVEAEIAEAPAVADVAADSAAG